LSLTPVRRVGLAHWSQPEPTGDGGAGKRRANKTALSTLRGRVCAVRAGGPKGVRLCFVPGGWLLRNQIRELVHRPRQVVKPPVGVSGREFELGVSREFLKGSQVDSRPTAERQVGVTQRVEVGVSGPSGPSTE
jgi:hypothetical protein